MAEVISIHISTPVGGAVPALYYYRAFCDCGSSWAVNRPDRPLRLCACGLLPEVRPCWGPPAPAARIGPPDIIA